MLAPCAVVEPDVEQWRDLAGKAGAIHGLDTNLILAIIARESGGGRFLTPRGPNGWGDNGNAVGLMQIDKRYHDTTGLEDPVLNVDCGCGILSGYIAECGGDIPAGICSYNAGPTKALALQRGMAPDATPAQRAHVYDGVTTNRDYVSDVLARQAEYYLASYAA